MSSKFAFVDELEKYGATYRHHFEPANKYLRPYGMRVWPTLWMGRFGKTPRQIQLMGEHVLKDAINRYCERTVQAQNHN